MLLAPTIGPWEIAIVALVVILLFGVGKLSGLGKDLGSSIKEFRRAMKDGDEEETTQQQTQPAPQQQQYSQTTVQPQQQSAPPPSNSAQPQENERPNVF